jgi:hypothetical protein
VWDVSFSDNAQRNGRADHSNLAKASEFVFFTLC